MHASENRAKKRVGETANVCASGLPQMPALLPVVDAVVGGRKVTALIDTGCSRSIISGWLAKSVGPDLLLVKESVVMMNGDVSRCSRQAQVEIELKGLRLPLNCLVSNVLPGVDVLLGMDAISCAGGAKFDRTGKVEFLGWGPFCAAAAAEARVADIDTEDFLASFGDGR